MTEAESLLWEHLRKSQIGCKFRRQHPIGDYIADFVCLSKRIIVEVDGGYHLQPDVIQSDEERTAFLQEQGYKVLRFTNEEVINSIEQVTIKIKRETMNSSSNSNLPSLGGARGRSPFSIIQSTCLPIAIDNCNTDLIIPARYMASTTRDPQFFGNAFMHDLRFDANEKPIEDFVLNKPAFTEAPRKGVHEIIVGGQNWGSGSSREHAAWAIAGYGVRVVISSSFADIHRNNLLNCFVLPVVVSEEFRVELLASIKADANMEVKVDVPNQMVTNLATGRSEKFDINGYKKYCLMNALDDIDFLLKNKDKIEEFEKNI